MTPETLRYAFIMFAAGMGIPVLAALNAQLGGRIGSPAAAAVVLFCVALLAALVVTALTTGVAPLKLAAAQPKHLFLAGLLIAFYVISITTVAPRFGIGNAVFFVLLGQMVAAGAIDHFGLLGAKIRLFTPPRMGGLGLMALGIYLIQRG